jgi:hypothetical protein
VPKVLVGVDRHLEQTFVLQLTHILCESSERLYVVEPSAKPLLQVLPMVIELCLLKIPEGPGASIDGWLRETEPISRKPEPQVFMVRSAEALS